MHLALSIGRMRACVVTLHDGRAPHPVAGADRFRRHASHELRTPLASVLGFIETLQGPAKDDAIAREKFLGDHGRSGRVAWPASSTISCRCRIKQKLHMRPDAVDLTTIVAQIVDGLRARPGDGVEIRFAPAVRHRDRRSRRIAARRRRI